MGRERTILPSLVTGLRRRVGAMHLPPLRHGTLGVCGCLAEVGQQVIEVFKARMIGHSVRQHGRGMLGDTPTAVLRVYDGGAVLAVAHGDSGHGDRDPGRDVLLAPGRAELPRRAIRQPLIRPGHREEVLELAHNAHVLFESRPATEKRKLLDFVLSNCTWKGGELTAKYRQPFDVLAVAVASEQQRVGEGMAETGKNEIWLPIVGSNPELFRGRPEWRSRLARLSRRRLPVWS